MYMKVFHLAITFFPNNVAVLATEEKHENVLIQGGESREALMT